MSPIPEEDEQVEVQVEAAAAPETLNRVLVGDTAFVVEIIPESSRRNVLSLPVEAGATEHQEGQDGLLMKSAMFCYGYMSPAEHCVAAENYPQNSDRMCLMIIL